MHRAKPKQNKANVHPFLGLTSNWGRLSKRANGRIKNKSENVNGILKKYYANKLFP
jgi:hypothetical protein